MFFYYERVEHWMLFVWFNWSNIYFNLQGFLSFSNSVFIKLENILSYYLSKTTISLEIKAYPFIKNIFKLLMIISSKHSRISSF